MRDEAAGNLPPVRPIYRRTPPLFRDSPFGPPLSTFGPVPGPLEGQSDWLPRLPSPHRPTLPSIRSVLANPPKPAWVGSGRYRTRSELCTAEARTKATAVEEEQRVGGSEEVEEEVPQDVDV